MKHILIILSLALMASCSKSGGGNSNREPQRPQYLGDLEKKAQEIYSEESHLVGCDLGVRNRILEVTAAVEANRDNINEIRKKRIVNDGLGKFLNFGDFEIIETSANDNPDLWKIEKSSWKEVYEIYLEIKNDPMHRYWVYVNSEARSLIVEDEDRIVRGSHPWVRRLEGERVLRLKANVKTCYQNESCTAISLTPDDRAWLERGEFHKYAISRLDSNDSDAVKRRWVRFLHNTLGWAAGQFEFEKYTAARVENNVLIIPLDLSVFGKDARKFIDRVQSTWSVHGLSLKVENHSSGFKVLVEKLPGSRAYVSYGKKIMQLFAPVSLDTIDHEFGHILGLTDTYFTSFDPVTCEYNYEVNYGDMMSGKGQVLPTHIQQIKQNYGIQ